MKYLAVVIVIILTSSSVQAQKWRQGGVLGVQRDEMLRRVTNESTATDTIMYPGIVDAHEQDIIKHVSLYSIVEGTMKGALQLEFDVDGKITSATWSRDTALPVVYDTDSTDEANLKLHYGKLHIKRQPTLANYRQMVKSLTKDFGKPKLDDNDQADYISHTATWTLGEQQSLMLSFENGHLALAFEAF